MKNDFYIAEDGKIHVKSESGRTASVDPSDSDFVGGGYKIIPKLVLADDGSYEVSKEIVNTCAGYYFSDNRSISHYGIGNQNFRTAPYERKELLDECYRLWKYDPIGGIIVNLTTYFVFGRGITINYPDPENVQILKKFWKKNQMEKKAKSICDEGTAFGENYILLKVFKEDVKRGGKYIYRSGDVKLSTIDPKNIDAIEHSADDVNDVVYYHISYEGENSTEVKKKVKDFSRFDSSVDTECIFHLKFNCAMSDAFGLSDLVRIKEWLDNYQDFLRDSVIINKLYRSPSYDITIKDGDEADIARAAARYAGWKIGSNPIHNDKETWEILEFTGSNVSQENSRRALLLIVAAGVGMPEYMLADGSNANLASTKSQQLPAIKRFEDYQDRYSELYVSIFNFVLEMKLIFGKGKVKPHFEKDFEGDYDWKGTVSLPEIVTENDSAIAEYTSKLVEKGLSSKSSALMRNGMNYSDELAKIRKENDESIEVLKDLIEKLKTAGLEDSEARAVAISVVFPSPQKFQPEVPKPEPVAPVTKPPVKK